MRYESLIDTLRSIGLDEYEAGHPITCHEDAMAALSNSPHSELLDRVDIYSEYLVD